MTEDRVLVTGVSGYIAMHTAMELLKAGYRVRGTVRTPAREASIRAALERQVTVGDRLEIVRADLTSDDGWSEAVKDCRFVHHIASPLPRKPPKDEQELIGPAKEGALRVLRAAAEAGVERVVMTSSVAAIVYGQARDGSKVYDEKDWSLLGPSVGAYEKSKTIAERAAWELIESMTDGPQLVVINPGLVMGPLLEEDYGTSGEVVRKLMRRELPGCPDVGWAVVDVRDVSWAHVQAMTTPQAEGKRFCIAIEHASMLDIAKILAANFQSKGYKIPLRKLPDWLLKTVSIFDKTAALAVPELGLRQDVSNRRARDILGYKPRSLEEMVTSMGQSMIEFGVV